MFSRAKTRCPTMAPRTSPRLVEWTRPRSLLDPRGVLDSDLARPCWDP
jgi:hypothetical protein